MPNGKPPTAGAVVSQKELAQSYRRIAAGGGDEFYRGDLGRRLVDAVQAAGGWITEADLARYAPTWRPPLAIDYRGYSVHCPGPPSSGFQYLECLRMLEANDLGSCEHNSADYLHLLLETIKLASADRTRYASAEPAIVAALLSAEYAAERRQLIDARPRRAE